MIEYKIYGDLVQEVVNGVITAVWEKYSNISESVKNQLISKGGKDIEKFFAEKPTELEKIEIPIIAKPIKKPIKKKKKMR